MANQKKTTGKAGKLSKHTFESCENEPNGDEDDTESESEVNIIIVGNRRVGKTSFLFKYMTNMYSDMYQPTYGVDFRKTTVTTHAGTNVDLKLWDTSGGDVNSPSVQNIFGFANAFIIMYDVTDIQSYNDVFHWMEIIHKFSLDNAQRVVIGNKIDLTAERQLSKEDGMKLASAYDGKFMETSVSHNKNIQNTIKTMTSNLTSKNHKSYNQRR